MQLAALLPGPNGQVRNRIIKELKEDPQRFEHQVALLETWMDCHDFLPKNYDKRILPFSLRSCKHDMERTKRKLENYFIARTTHEDLFGNRSMSLDKDLKVTTYVNIVALPELTPEGYRILLIRSTNSDASFTDALDMARYALMLAEIEMHFETMASGCVFVSDFTNVTMAHFVKHLVPVIKRTLDILQHSFPIRLKQVHCINSQPFVVKMFRYIKAILKEKLKKRIFYHTSPEQLAEFFPLRLLPSEYGGEKESCAKLNEDLVEALVASREWFDELGDVTIKRGTPKRLELSRVDDFGYQGSFRQLTID